MYLNLHSFVAGLDPCTGHILMTILVHRMHRRDHALIYVFSLISRSLCNFLFFILHSSRSFSQNSFITAAIVRLGFKRLCHVETVFMSTFPTAAGSRGGNGRKAVFDRHHHLGWR